MNFTKRISTFFVAILTLGSLWAESWPKDFHLLVTTDVNGETDPCG